MAVMEWIPAYSVKVKKYDDQHKKLVDLINQLHDAMKAGEGNLMLGVILQSLIAYTSSHFADEEKMMQSNVYPDYARHKAIHDSLVKRVLELQQQFQEGRVLLTMDLLSFLKEWLVTHIQVEDKKYGVYFNDKGIC